MLVPLAGGTQYAAQNLQKSAVLVYAVLKSNLVCWQQDCITGLYSSVVTQAADMKTTGQCTQSMVTAHG